MRLKGAIPIPYVVALIFGIIVIALLGYWFVVQGGKTLQGGELAGCNAKQMTYCQSWRNTGFNIKPVGFNWDSSCQEPLGEGGEDTLTDKCINLLSCETVNIHPNQPCPQNKPNYYGIRIRWNSKVCCST